MLNEALVNCKASEGRVIPVLVIWELGQVKEKNSKKGMDTQKLIHSVKNHILHQKNPYLNTNTI